jgi:hypothetical protein
VQVAAVLIDFSIASFSTSSTPSYFSILVAQS